VGSPGPGGRAGVITVAGEALVDVIVRDGGERTVHPGGSAANVAVALSRLGQRAVLVTQLGADGHGDLIRAHLAGNGVELIQAGPVSAPTSESLATLGAGGGASYEFRLSWDVPGARIAAGSVALHAGSLGVLLPPGGQRVIELMESACRDGGLVTSYDPNVRPSVTPDRRAVAAVVERAAASAHIVKVSEEDLGFLFPGMTPARFADRLLGAGGATSLLVVTRGGEGALVATREVRFSAAAVPVTVADTVGAGDAFTAALLAGLAKLGMLTAGALAGRVSTDSGALHELADQALAAAALTCTRAGANPPTTAELRRFRGIISGQSGQ
jgi:fructokinase